MILCGGCTCYTHCGEKKNAPLDACLRSRTKKTSSQNNHSIIVQGLTDRAKRTAPARSRNAPEAQSHHRRRRRQRVRPSFGVPVVGHRRHLGLIRPWRCHGDQLFIGVRRTRFSCCCVGATGRPAAAGGGAEGMWALGNFFASCPALKFASLVF